jgi:hypothetical protein
MGYRVERAHILLATNNKNQRRDARLLRALICWLMVAGMLVVLGCASSPTPPPAAPPADQPASTTRAPAPTTSHAQDADLPSLRLRSASGTPGSSSSPARAADTRPSPPADADYAQTEGLVLGAGDVVRAPE